MSQLQIPWSSVQKDQQTPSRTHSKSNFVNSPARLNRQATLRCPHKRNTGATKDVPACDKSCVHSRWRQGLTVHSWENLPWDNGSHFHIKLYLPRWKMPTQNTGFLLAGSPPHSFPKTLHTCWAALKAAPTPWCSEGTARQRAGRMGEARDSASPCDFRKYINKRGQNSQNITLAQGVSGKITAVTNVTWTLPAVKNPRERPPTPDLLLDCTTPHCGNITPSWSWARSKSLSSQPCKARSLLPPRTPSGLRQERASAASCSHVNTEERRRYRRMSPLRTTCAFSPTAHAVSFSSSGPGQFVSTGSSLPRRNPGSNVTRCVCSYRIIFLNYYGSFSATQSTGLEINDWKSKT